MSDYPPWICAPCGRKHGTRVPQTAAWHTPDEDDPSDFCGWCGTRTTALTEPRDFGYPPVHTAWLETQ